MKATRRREILELLAEIARDAECSNAGQVDGWRATKALRQTVENKLQQAREEDKSRG